MSSPFFSQYLFGLPLFVWHFTFLTNINLSSVWRLYMSAITYVLLSNKGHECPRCDSKFISYGFVCSVFSPWYSSYFSIAVVFKCIYAFCYVLIRAQVSIGMWNLEICMFVLLVTSFMLLFVACMPLNNAVSSAYLSSYISCPFILFPDFLLMSSSTCLMIFSVQRLQKIGRQYAPMPYSLANREPVCRSTFYSHCRSFVVCCIGFGWVK